MKHKHKFVFLRQIWRKINYRERKPYDVFFCESCLEYVERAAPQDESL